MAPDDSAFSVVRRVPELLRRVVDRVLSCGVLPMFLRMEFVPVSEVRVVTRLFVITFLGVMSGLFVVLCSLQKMAGSFLVVFSNSVALHEMLLRVLRFVLPTAGQIHDRIRRRRHCDKAGHAPRLRVKLARR
ncbi:MAG TPA: hypothetical protein VGM74_09335 [Burkholderiaceae bacterium]|jgi:hypothetical protein